MVAVSCVAETIVVIRGMLFHSTVLPGTKLLPVTVSVKSAPPEGTDTGASVLATGAAIKLPLPLMLLVNNRIAPLVVPAGASPRRANPLEPQRTICVPVVAAVCPNEPKDSDAVCANDV